MTSECPNSNDQCPPEIAGILAILDWSRLHWSLIIEWSFIGHWSLVIGHWSFQDGSFGFRLDSAKEMIGRDVEDRAIVTPIAVRRRFVGVHGAEMFAVGRKHQHAARTRGEEISVLVHLHPVRQALFCF